ncbi:MAG: deoxyribonuclease II family protein [Myxococcota bacterium]
MPCASPTTGDWVRVADINRQASQGKRGGGAVCFEHPSLWKSLSAIECVDKPTEPRPQGCTWGRVGARMALGGIAAR